VSSGNVAALEECLECFNQVILEEAENHDLQSQHGQSDVSQSTHMHALKMKALFFESNIEIFNGKYEAALVLLGKVIMIATVRSTPSC
jgi:hypothetical protein